MVVLKVIGKVTPDLSVSVMVYKVTVLPSITEVSAVTVSVEPLTVTVVVHSKVETPELQTVVPELVWLNDESVDGIVTTDPSLRVEVLSVIE